MRGLFSSCGERGLLFFFFLNREKRSYLINLFFMNLFYFWLRWVFVAARGLSPAVASRGHSWLRCAGFPLWRPLFVSEHGLQACGLQQLWHVGSVVLPRGLQSTGSVVVVPGLSCSTACGILPDQGSNPCSLHRQADSQPLRHQRSPGGYS